MGKKTALILSLPTLLCCAPEQREEREEPQSRLQKVLEEAWEHIHETYGPIRDVFTLEDEWMTQDRWEDFRNRLNALFESERQLFNVDMIMHIEPTEEQLEHAERLRERTTFEQPLDVQQLTELAQQYGRAIEKNIDEGIPEIVLIGDYHNMDDENDTQILNAVTVSGSRLLFEGLPNLTGDLMLYRVLHSTFGNQNPDRLTQSIRLLCESEKRNIYINGADDAGYLENALYMIRAGASVYVARAYMLECVLQNIRLEENLAQYASECSDMINQLAQLYMLTLRDRAFIQHVTEQITHIQQSPQEDYVVLTAGERHFRGSFKEFLDSTNTSYVHIIPNMVSQAAGEQYAVEIIAGESRESAIGMNLEGAMFFKQVYEHLCHGEELTLSIEWR